MVHELDLSLTPENAASPARYTPIVARMLRVKDSRIAFVRIVRRAIDARRGVKVVLRVQVYVDEEVPVPDIRFDYGDVSGKTPVAIVGSGPAGLFAALRLIELGYRPLVFERGKEVSDRKRDIAALNRNGAVDPDSNYAFGEGGAGTFSDGKLFTRSKKRGDFRKALEVFHFHGADESILYDAHPHIGTDKLPRVIVNIRKTIADAGGQFFFGSRITDMTVRQGRVASITDSNGNRVDAAAVILATGHSARDIYELLHARGIALEAKPFAMGVRVEHPQGLIDSIQYHMPDRGGFLPAASYSLVAQAGGRGVYSFCMCPGGFIVPALTAPGEAVVNGMSPSGRNSRFANAGVVTEVRAEDFAHLLPEHGALAGLRLQQQLEQLAHANGGPGQIVPAQRLTDFLSGKLSASLPETSYHPGVASSEMGGWMPEFISQALKHGFAEFGRKMKGFVTDQALMLGVESRTSSPVKIPRDPLTLMHPQVAGLFPAAEGAGYAGGIVSAAIDGERCAEQAVRWLETARPAI